MRQINWKKKIALKPWSFVSDKKIRFLYVTKFQQTVGIEPVPASFVIQAIRRLRSATTLEALVHKDVSERFNCWQVRAVDILWAQ